jgi:hypothetical protein
VHGQPKETRTAATTPLTTTSHVYAYDLLGSVIPTYSSPFSPLLSSPLLYVCSWCLMASVCVQSGAQFWSVFPSSVFLIIRH